MLDRLRMLNSYFVYSFNLKGSWGSLAYTETCDATQANVGGRASLFSLSILQGATLKINKEGNTINLFYISIQVKSLNQKISSK